MTAILLFFGIMVLAIFLKYANPIVRNDIQVERAFRKSLEEERLRLARTEKFLLAEKEERARQIKYLEKCRHKDKESSKNSPFRGLV